MSIGFRVIGAVKNRWDEWEDEDSQRLYDANAADQLEA